MIQTPRFPPPMLSSPHLMGDASRPLSLGWELRTIVLEEVSPPPRLNSSSALPTPPGGDSSSYFTSSSSGSEASIEEEQHFDDDDDEDSDMGSESYCSSDDDEDDTLPEHYPDVAARRVLAWRTSFCPQLRSELHQPQTPSGALPRTSLPIPYSHNHGASPATLSLQHGTVASPGPVTTIYRCAACEAPFTTSQLYREHGEQTDAPEACRAAVSYGLEP